MLNMIMAYVQAARNQEEGQALVEYALILALVSIVSVAALTLLGTSISDLFGTITDELA